VVHRGALQVVMKPREKDPVNDEDED